MKASPAVLLLLLACASAPPPPAPTPAAAAATLPGCDRGGEGEEGGVEGGVVAAGTGSGPLFLPPSVGRAQNTADFKDPRNKVQVPPELAKPGTSYWGLFKVCVSEAGAVTEVLTLRSTCVLQIDESWIATIKTWPHRPYEKDGSPRPFCYPQRLLRRFPAVAATTPPG